MAKAAVETHGVSIRLARECLCISETCYRYEAKLGIWFVLPAFAEHERLSVES